jgi:HEAT repeat protein
MARRPNIGRLKRRGDLDGLVAALEHRDYARTRDGEIVEIGAPVREAAVEALADFNAPQVLEGLYAALRDPDAGVRGYAIARLAGRDEPEVAELLARAVVDWPAGDPAGVDAAWTALAGLNRETGVAPLVIRALLEADGDLPAYGVLIYATLDASPSQAADEDEILRLLVQAVSGPDPDRAARAGVMLGWLRDRSLPALLSVVREGSSKEATLALARTRDRSATPALIRLLTSEDVELRRAAARGLAELRDPRAVQELVRASDDEDYDVRCAAIDAVNRLGGVAVILGVAATIDSHFASMDATGTQRAELPPPSDNGVTESAAAERRFSRFAAALRREVDR